MKQAEPFLKKLKLNASDPIRFSVRKAIKLSNSNNRHNRNLGASYWDSISAQLYQNKVIQEEIKCRNVGSHSSSSPSAKPGEISRDGQYGITNMQGTQNGWDPHTIFNYMMKKEMSNYHKERVAPLLEEIRRNHKIIGNMAKGIKELSIESEMSKITEIDLYAMKKHPIQETKWNLPKQKSMNIRYPAPNDNVGKLLGLGTARPVLDMTLKPRTRQTKQEIRHSISQENKAMNQSIKKLIPL